MQNYSAIREKYQLDNPATDREQLAYLTHFLQNSKNGVSKFYADEAQKYYFEIQEKLDLVEDHGI